MLKVLQMHQPTDPHARQGGVAGRHGRVHVWLAHPQVLCGLHSSRLHLHHGTADIVRHPNLLPADRQQDDLRAGALPPGPFQ